MVPTTVFIIYNNIVRYNNTLFLIKLYGMDHNYEWNLEESWGFQARKMIWLPTRIRTGYGTLDGIREQTGCTTLIKARVETRNRTLWKTGPGPYVGRSVLNKLNRKSLNSMGLKNSNKGGSYLGIVPQEKVELMGKKSTLIPQYFFVILGFGIAWVLPSCMPSLSKIRIISQKNPSQKIPQQSCNLCQCRNRGSLHSVFRVISKPCRCLQGKF